MNINLKNIKLLSVDIFDTLVFRICNKPSDIFDLMANKVSVNSNFLQSASEFTMLRQNAESIARKKSKYLSDEVDITKIYEFMPNSLGNKKELIKIEVETEIKYSFLNPKILEFLDQVRKKDIPIILTSDMYLGCNYISLILKKLGFPLHIINKIYVSCDHDKSKSKGNIWNLITKDHNMIKPDSILHIGDNFDSDYLIPTKYGVRTIHYNRNCDYHEKILTYENVYFNNTYRFNQFRKNAVLGCKTFNIETIIGASILGPVFVFFSYWINKIAENNKKKHIYVFTRESEILVPLLKFCSDSLQNGLVIEPLFVSRESTWLASLNEWNIDSCNKLLNSFEFTIRDIFNSLEIKIPKLLNNENIDKRVLDCNDDYLQKIKTTLLNKTNVSKINNLIKNRSYLLNEYISNTVKSLENTIFVDLGFSGSISLNIENNFIKHNIKSKILHTFLFSNDQIISLKQKNISTKSYYSYPGFNQEMSNVIYSSLMPIEQLILGRTGTTSSYKKTKLSVKPVILDIKLPKSDISIKNNALNGIIQFQTFFHNNISFLNDNFINVFDHSLRTDLISLLYRLINCPTTEEANVLGSLHHDVNAGSLTIRKVCSENDIRLVKKTNDVEEFISVSKLNKVHWPQALIALNFKHHLIKSKLKSYNDDHYLFSMLRLVSYVKTLNFSEISIYGAGLVGKTLKKAALLYSLNIHVFIDSKNDLWGRSIDSTEITSLEKAVLSNNKIPILIASFQFIDQIENIIKNYDTKLTFFSIRDIPRDH